jgi:hypothetical protein
MTLSLEQALAELPDTADGIAAYLTEQDCRGKREDGDYCPIATYLRGIGFLAPHVDPDVAFVGGAETVHLPDGARQFVYRFDEGEWPQLDIEVTE